jgi:hypothetical protein
MAELGVEASALAVVRHLQSRVRLDGFILDAVDADLAPAVAALDVAPLVADTIMRDAASKQRLARAALGLAERLLTGKP